MLTQVNKLKASAELLHDTATQIGNDAAAAVETLRGCREFVTKTVASLTEDHKAVLDALTERHSHVMGEFNEMLTRIDETIAKLEGSANG